MPRPTTHYHLQEKVVRVIEDANLDLNGLRLFHALHALSERVLTSGGLPSLTLPHVPTPAILTAEINRFIMPTSSNDLDALRAGLASLAKTQLVSELKHDTTRHRIEARLANHVASAAARLKNGRFAALSADRVRACNSAAEVLFYTRAEMHGRSDFPKFQLPNAGEDPPWSTNSMKRWLRAARVFSLRLDHAYILQPTSCPMSGDRKGVTVKISHHKTIWSSECLYDRNPRHLPTVVVAGVARRLERGELERRHTWRYVDRPV